MHARCHIPAATGHHLHGIPLLLQRGGSLGARSGQVGEVPAVHQGTHLGQHGPEILVGHGTKNGVCGGEEPHRIQVGREGRHRMGVVRHVQHQGRLAGHDLESAGQLHEGQTIAHGLCSHREAVAQGLQCRQHARGVDQLIGAPQGGIGQPGIAPPPTRPAPLLLVTREVEIAPEAPQVRPDLAGMVHHALWGHGVAHDHRTAGAHDARLLPANAFAVGPQKLGVVDVDAGDHGAVGIDDVGRIQPPAQAHFQDRDIQPRMAHQPQDGQGGELKVGQRNFFTILDPCALHSFEVRYQIRSRHAFAVHTATLLKMH